MILHPRFRQIIKRTAPKIVMTTASAIAQRKLGPAPSTIGIGPTNTTAPKVADVPERTRATMTRIVPTKIKKKPKRNRLSGIDHETVSNNEASCLTRTQHSEQNHARGSKHSLQTIRPHL